MRFLLATLVLLGSVLQTSCQNAETGQPVIQHLSADEFQKKLNEKSNAQLIDVRTQKEYRERHLKGATLMNINEPGFNEMISTLDKEKPVFVYCLAGGRSSNAAERMQEAGFKEVYNMKGGLVGWSASGLPLEESAAGTGQKGMKMNEFEGMVQSKPYVLVDYHAVWCGPCKKIAPVLEKFTTERAGQMMLLKIDADENPSLLKEKGIQAIPHIELYKDGKLIWTHSGLLTAEELKQAVGF